MSTDWIVQCNINHYNVIDAFKDLHKLNWKQTTNIKVNDIVYIYVSSPVSALKYKTRVTKVNLPNIEIDDSKYVLDGSNYLHHGRYMELKFIHEYEDTDLPYSLLQSYGLKNIQGPNRLKLNTLHIINTYHLPDSDDEYQKIINQLPTKELTREEYKPTPVKREKVILKNKQWKRDPSIALRSLLRANFTCEIDANHVTFIKKSNNKPYTEAHHLIPMASQDKFEHSLDVEANIVSLCSNCHNEIHYGIHSHKLVEQLYIQKEDELCQAGIYMKFNDLLKLY